MSTDIRNVLPLVGLLGGLVAVGCGSSHKAEATTPTKVADKGPRSDSRATPLPIEGQASDGHCDGKSTSGMNFEVSEYDTSGDDTTDVRKVFLRIGDGPLARLVLMCRESDLNGDGKKDVVRYYSDEGKPLREEADRNFNGKMDEVTFFQEGQILRQEFDDNGDGKVDSKLFFDKGKPLRAERDLKARSTVERWQPDRWEYYEEGRVVRMGTDLDGDGKVDRWDRDISIRRSPNLGETPTNSEDTTESTPT